MPIEDRPKKARKPGAIRPQPGATLTIEHMNRTIPGYIVTDQEIGAIAKGQKIASAHWSMGIGLLSFGGATLVNFLLCENPKQWVWAMMIALIVVSIVVGLICAMIGYRKSREQEDEVKKIRDTCADQTKRASSS